MKQGGVTINLGLCHAAARYHGAVPLRGCFNLHVPGRRIVRMGSLTQTLTLTLPLQASGSRTRSNMSGHPVGLQAQIKWKPVRAIDIDFKVYL